MSGSQQSGINAPNALPSRLRLSKTDRRKDCQLVKPNYGFEKRQKELAKKAKKEEKRLKKLAQDAPAEEAPAAPEEVKPTTL